MKLEPAIFGSRDKPDEQRKGMIAVCPECDNREWIVFQLAGHNHFHLQCSLCGTSYCPVGSCK